MGLVHCYDHKYHFTEFFDSTTGFYARSGVLDGDGKDTGVDPFMRSFPSLIDVGIMGHCVHGKAGICYLSGVQCYQNGLGVCEPNMRFEDFERIATECEGKCFQFALGGRGDPDQHERFADILRCCRDHKIVPNFTSSGLGFNDEIVRLCKEFCGAVAISWYRQEHTYEALRMLLSAGVKTNIHYVLGRNSIDEAIERLKNRTFPSKVNAVIFLLHKPVGLGLEENTLDENDERVAEFFRIVDEGNFPFKIGFDSCSVPGILNLTKRVSRESVDTCEGARWSMYIDSNMTALPCSFDNQEKRWAFDLNGHTIKEAWESEQFENFRNHFRCSCHDCKDRSACMGGCPIRPQVVLCGRNEKHIAV